MDLVIKPAQSIKGKINLPSSKSYSIRAFIIAACGGTSTIINPSNSDDVKVSMSTAQSLGASVNVFGNGIYKIEAPKNPPKLSKINVKESGTVLRFLLPILSLRKEQFLVTGEGTLKTRPNRFLTETLRQMGVDI